MSQVVGLHNNSYKPTTNTTWVRARLCKLQKGCTRLAAASDNVYQLLVHGRWFSPGTLASSTTKTDRHEIAEILLKVALNTKHQIKSNHIQCRQFLNFEYNSAVILSITTTRKRRSIKVWKKTNIYLKKHKTFLVQALPLHLIILPSNRNSEK